MLIFFLSKAVVAQIRHSSANSDSQSATNNYFTLQDSINLNAFLITGRKKDKLAGNAIKWTLIGGVLGLTFAAIVVEDQNDCCIGCAMIYALAPPIGAGVGFLAGMIIGISQAGKQKTKVNTSLIKKVPLQQIGFMFPYPMEDKNQPFQGRSIKPESFTEI